MTYTKTTWIITTPITTTLLDHVETQYDEWETYYDVHSHTTTYYTQTQSDSLFWGTHNDGPDSGADADLIYYPGGDLHAAALLAMGVPIGLYILWYSSVGSIPSGWALANGSNGTLDLRDKFVPGAGDAYAVGGAGGSATFTVYGTVAGLPTQLTAAQLPDHYHAIEDTYNWNPASMGTPSGTVGSCGDQSRVTGSTGGTSTHSHSGGAITGTPVASLPPYHALCFIKKTS